MSHAALEEIRVRAVQAVLDGQSPEVVIKAIGMTRGCIYKWLAAYEGGGFAALAAKKIVGRPCTLTATQLKWLFRVTKRDPRQLYFEFALWTSTMLRAALWQEFRVKVSKPTMCRVLHRLGLTPQRPLHRAIQRDKRAIEHWLAEEYPTIQNQANEVGATIYFGDEAGISSRHHSGTTWALEGRTPVVATTGQRFSLTMISAVSARGDMRFMVLDHSMKTPDFVQFLERLLVGAKKPLFLIVDNLKVHKNGTVDDFVLATGGKLRLFYLPAYAPELNPDELVWNDLKRRLGRQGCRNRRELKSAVIGHLRRLQKTPAKVRSFFRERHCQYAAMPSY